MPQPSEVEQLSAALRAMYQRVWDDIQRRQQAVEQDLLLRRPERLARLREMQASIERSMRQVDEQARQFVTGGLPRAYALGGTTAGANFTWTAAHIEAATILARDTYGDLLAASRTVNRTVRKFVQEASKIAVERAVVGGDTAVAAARQAALDLIDRHGVYAVVYKDGSRHGIAEYAEVVVRTKTAVAYNFGTINQLKSMGVQYVEVFDGPSCIAPESKLQPYGNLLGVVRGWYSGSLRRITVALPAPGPANSGRDAQLLLGEPDGAAAAPEDLRDLLMIESLGRESGDLGPVEAVPARTHSTTIGPNHPVLTRRGWVLAGLLHEGDELVYDARSQSAKVLAEDDLEQMPSVEDVFTALLLINGPTATRRVTPDDLHGDGRFCQGEIQVVRPPGGLLVVADPGLVEHRREGDFMRSDAGPQSLPAASQRQPFVHGALGAADSVVGGGDLPVALLGGGSGPLVLDRARRRAELPLAPGVLTRHDLAALLAGVGHGAAPPPIQAVVGAEPARAHVLGREGGAADLADGGPAVASSVRLPHGCSFVTVVSVEQVPYEGWVYDATTEFGALNVDGILLRNCGWTSHNDTDLANGSIRTVDEAAAFPTSHPRCQRGLGGRPDLTTPEQAASATATTTAAQRADAAQVEQARLAETQARAVRQSASQRRQAKVDARTARLSR